MNFSAGVLCIIGATKTLRFICYPLTRVDGAQRMESDSARIWKALLPNFLQDGKSRKVGELMVLTLTLKDGNMHHCSNLHTGTHKTRALHVCCDSSCYSSSCYSHFLDVVRRRTWHREIKNTGTGPAKSTDSRGSESKGSGRRKRMFSSDRKK